MPEANDEVVPSNTEPPTPNLQRQREEIRRKFLRANTAVAVILVIVFALAAAAVVQSFRATQHEQRAREAQAVARRELWNALLTKSRAVRLGETLERRAESLETIKQAAAIRRSPELRNEAIASLALLDFLPEQTWELPNLNQSQLFDRELRNYAVALPDGNAVVRRLSDNAELCSLARTNAGVAAAQSSIQSMEFAPGGNLICVRYGLGAVVVWDMATGKPVFRHGVDTLRYPMSSGRFSSDAKHLVFPVAEDGGQVLVFDLTTSQEVGRVGEFKPWYHSLPRPGTTQIAIGGTRDTVELIDWTSGTRITNFHYGGSVQALVWSEDGRQLAIGGSLPDVHVWNLDTNQRRVFSGHTAEIWHLAFDHTGKRLASSSRDGTSRVWEMQFGRLLGLTSRGNILAFGDDERIGVELPGRSVEVRRLVASNSHRVLAGPENIENATWALDVASNGRWLVSAAQTKGLVTWDLDGNTPPIFLPRPLMRSVCFHPRELKVAVTFEDGAEWREPELDAAGSGLDLQRVTTIPMPTEFSPYVLTVSGDGRKLGFVSAMTGRCFISDADEPQKLVWLRRLAQRSVQHPGASASGGGTLALSADGRWAACGYDVNAGTRVWDTRSSNVIATLSLAYGIVQFSPDNRWLVLGESAHYKLFSTADWKEVWHLERERATTIGGSCAFAPDSKLLAIAPTSQKVALVDTTTGREIAALATPLASTIKCIRWTRDGKRLVIGTGENLVQVWDLPRLRDELAALGLNWGDDSDPPLLASAGITTGLTPGQPLPAALMVIAFGLCSVGAVAVLALLALRRHRMLIEDFARTEAVAVQRERELHVEREVGQLKSSFVSMVSHEFRTPLGIILSSAQILKNYFKRLTEGERTEQLSAIESSVRRMKELIEEVLLLGKVESGRMQCQPAPVELASLCRRLIADVKTATAPAAPIELVTENLSGEASLDQSLVEIILTNLLSNAVKYSPAGKPVRLTARSIGKDAVLEVRDEGIGIPAADQPELFKSFHRGRNVGNLPGTGLGLTIVKRCVELHGGTISVTSTEGEGTTFTVRLPAYSS